MEVINNMAAVAAKAVWGSQAAQKPSTAEPVSGKTGDVSKGEPYDAGNLESQLPEEAQKPAASETPASAVTSSSLTSPVAKSSEEPADAAVTSSSLTNTVSKPSAEPSDPAVPVVSEDPSTQPLDDATAKSADAPAPNPAVTQPSSAEPGDSTEAQNDVRAPEEPATRSDDPATRAKEDVDNRDNAPLEDTVSPDKLAGPGPRPVEELAKERGGDAGAVDNDSHPASSSTPDVAAPDHSQGDTNQQQKEGDGSEQDKGAGDQWVKTSGLQAEGGNFDASAAGAGREADRLLEEKGLRNDSPGPKTEGRESYESVDRSSNGSGGGSPGKKHRLLKKLKAKLPLHHKKHEA